MKINILDVSVEMLNVSKNPADFWTKFMKC